MEKGRGLLGMFEENDEAELMTNGDQVQRTEDGKKEATFRSFSPIRPT